MIALPPPPEPVGHSNGLIDSHKDKDKCDKKRSWLLLTLCAAVSCYLHTFGAVSVAIIYVSLLVYLCINDKSRVKWCILSGVSAVVLFSPWLAETISRYLRFTSTGFWAPEIGVFDVLHFLLLPINYGGKIGGVLSVVFILLYACIATRQSSIICQMLDGAVDSAWLCEQRQNAYFAAASLSVYVFTVAIGCIASWISTPIFVARYAVQGIPLVGLSFTLLLPQLDSTGSDRHGQMQIKPIVMCLLAAAALFANIVTFTKKEADEAKRYEEFVPILSQITSDDIIITNVTNYAGTLSCMTRNKVKVYDMYKGDKGSSTEKYQTEEDANANNIRAFNYTLFRDYADIPFGTVQGNVYFAMGLNNADEREQFVKDLQDIGLGVQFMGEYWLDESYHIKLFILNRAGGGAQD